MDSKATGRIIITETPHGEAPEAVRRGWVRCVLPCYPVWGKIPDVYGLKSGDKLSGDNIGFAVPQDEALKVLALRSPDSAAWFRKNGYPQHEQSFFFRREEADIVCGVSMQKVHVWSLEDRCWIM